MLQSNASCGRRQVGFGLTDGSLWQTFDGYASVAGQADIKLEVHGDGPHLLDIRSRAERNKNATGYKVRFEQLLVVDRTYDLRTIEYAYDNLARLLEARYNQGNRIKIVTPIPPIPFPRTRRKGEARPGRVFPLSACDRRKSRRGGG
jgi:hypothetical protein